MPFRTNAWLLVLRNVSRETMGPDAGPNVSRETL
jgi:hypothetical protein